MVGTSDAIGGLLIIALLIVILWRLFEVRRDNKTHKTQRKVDDERT
jgi:hypothetical protein